MCHDYENDDSVEHDDADSGDWNGLQCDVCGSLENVGELEGERLCQDCFGDMLT